MLRGAEPSEAYPTTLLRSFEGYPPRIHPWFKDPCLHAEVRHGTQAWLSGQEGKIFQKLEITKEDFQIKRVDGAKELNL